MDFCSNELWLLHPFTRRSDRFLRPYLPRAFYFCLCNFWLILCFLKCTCDTRCSCYFIYYWSAITSEQIGVAIPTKFSGIILNCEDSEMPEDYKPLWKINFVSTCDQHNKVMELSFLHFFISSMESHQVAWLQ